MLFKLRMCGDGFLFTDAVAQAAVAGDLAAIDGKLGA